MNDEEWLNPTEQLLVDMLWTPTQYFGWKIINITFTVNNDCSFTRFLVEYDLYDKSNRLVNPGNVTFIPVVSNDLIINIGKVFDFLGISK